MRKLIRCVATVAIAGTVAARPTVAGGVGKKSCGLC